MKQLRSKNFRKLLAVMTLTCIAVGVFASVASASSMPWDSPLEKLQTNLTGPFAFFVAVIAFVAAGAKLAFGDDLSGFTRGLLVIVCAVALIGGTASVLSSWFGLNKNATSGANIIAIEISAISNEHKV